MKEVALTQGAEENLQSIKHFHGPRWPSIERHLDATIHHIRLFPHTGVPVGNRRRAVCKYSRRLRFNIYYRVSGNAIIVSAIVPGALDQ